VPIGRTILNPAIFATAIASISLNSLAQVCLRKTMLLSGMPPADSSRWLPYALGISLNPWMVGGLACYAVSILLWMAVLSRVEVSSAYPLTSIGFVITATVGFFFLGETLTTAKIAGIILICAGLVFITRA
jgi:multidrug transporter EmrE-like cation transporter